MDVLPRPSDEQQLVIEAFRKGYNIKIEAVAGGGKTTTLLHLAKSIFDRKNEARNFSFPGNFELPLDSGDEMSFGSYSSPETTPENSPMSYDDEFVTAPPRTTKKCLLLTYNKSLQLDVKSRVENLGMESYLDVYTFHGFATRLYCSGEDRTPICNDKMLREHILSAQPHFRDVYDVVLIDEVQDMNQWFHQFVNIILKEFQPQVALVGDPRQCINQYMGSDLKYFTNPSEHFGLEFKTFKLRTSFRLTQATSQFVNNHLMSKSAHHNLLVGGNTRAKNIKPTYIIGAYRFGSYVDEAVKKYGCQNVMILAPSVKKSITGNPRTPLGKFLSTKHSYPITVKDEYATEHTLKNKLVISTFNSSKGMERKCIFVLNFDSGYPKFYARDYNDQCEPPNLLYVALTRAKQKLYVVQGDRDLPFHTVNIISLSEDCYVVGNPKKVKSRPPSTQTVKTVESVSKYRPLEDTLSMLEYLSISSIPTSCGYRDNSSLDRVEFANYFEDVKRFYEVLIPIMTQFLNLGDVNLDTLEPIGSSDPFFDVYSRYRQLQSLGFEYFTIREWVEFSICICTIADKCHFYFDQIRNYQWINQMFISSAITEFREVFNGKGKFFNHQRYETGDTTLIGKVDLISDTDLWIFKFSSTFSDSDRVRAGASSVLQYLITGKLLPCKLYNLKTSEMEVIHVNNPCLFSNKLFDLDLVPVSLSKFRLNSRKRARSH